jgi:hypothetical protein
MVLKSYFDGGNKADSSEYDHICLATVPNAQLSRHLLHSHLAA